MTSLIEIRKEIEKGCGKELIYYAPFTAPEPCGYKKISVPILCISCKAKLELLNKIEQGYSLVPKDESGVFRNQISEEYLKEHFIEKKKVLDVLNRWDYNLMLGDNWKGFARKQEFADSVKELKKELGVEE